MWNWPLIFSIVMTNKSEDEASVVQSKNEEMHERSHTNSSS